MSPLKRYLLQGVDELIPHGLRHNSVPGRQLTILMGELKGISEHSDKWRKTAPVLFEDYLKYLQEYRKICNRNGSIEIDLEPKHPDAAGHIIEALKQLSVSFSNAVNNAQLASRSSSKGISPTELYNMNAHLESDIKSISRAAKNYRNVVERNSDLL
ncbi:hypothetical protein GOV11_02240 [Candidatus Woesearchaeota archaeon]|nr:hypothetical protein [Candidatus Woesearchaeota archaeon]